NSGRSFQLPRTSSFKLCSAVHISLSPREASRAVEASSPLPWAAGPMLALVAHRDLPCGHSWNTSAFARAIQLLLRFAFQSGSSTASDSTDNSPGTFAQHGMDLSANAWFRQ